MLDKIKKINDRIYEFDFSQSALADGDEVVVANGVSELNLALSKKDFDKGIIASVGGYKTGLVYKSTNDGEFYNHPNWIPDIVSFSLNIFGIKKGAFYKITVVGRDTGLNRVITADRRLKITNEQRELLLDETLQGSYENKEYYF